jgi:hypothetical protein
VKTVLIRGEGVAASCCARLLDRAGLPLAFEAVNRPKLPAIMLSDATQKLLGDVFERGDLFQGLPRISKRVVLWGARSEPLSFPHSAVVISEQKLLNRIQPQSPHLACEKAGEPAWTIHSARPLPESAVEHHFGSRMATASPVKLIAGCDTEACWVESVDSGWLFLLPGGVESAWLLSVGDAVDALLAKSRLVAGQIGEIGLAGGRFPAHPRIADPLCGTGWLACGTGAMGFDPLCGDGTGHATREAILGAAVVHAVSDGANVDHVTAHYRSRLLAGFKRHLDVCREFYTAGQCGPWWERELEELYQGLEWCNDQLAGTTGFIYRLNGFALERVGSGGSHNY